MNNKTGILEDFATTPVPDSQTVPGYRIVLVLIGGLITLPVFLVGAQLGLELGFKRGLLAFVLAGVSVACIGAVSGIIAARTRVSTAMIIQRSFGFYGGAIASTIFGIAILGWYGATVDVFASAVDLLVKDVSGLVIPGIIYKILASLLMIGTAVFGFRALDKLSLFAVPLMGLFLIGLAYLSIQKSGLSMIVMSEGTSEMTVAQAVSAGIGGFIVGALMFPDLCRYARTPKAAASASFAGFGIGIPLVMVLAAIPTIALADSDFLRVVMAIGFGLQGLVLLLLATWTTNAFNLYSASLVFASIFRKIEKWQMVFIVGFVGTVIALLPILDNFLVFLHTLAIAIPPIAGIFFADFFIELRRKDNVETRVVPNFNPVALLAWGMGILIGYLSMKSVITITTVPALDALVTGMLIHLILNKILKNK